MSILFFNTPMECGFQYTDKNATDLLQVVNFTDLLQLVNKIQQSCQFHQVNETKTKLCIVFMVLIIQNFNGRVLILAFVLGLIN